MKKEIAVTDEQLAQFGAKNLLAYVVAYLNEELLNWGNMEYDEREVRDMVENAIDAYDGGAR